MKASERYFFIAYMYNSGVGNITMITSGGYINEKKTKDQIKEKYDSGSNIIITNIIELTKEDFDDLIA